MKVKHFNHLGILWLKFAKYTCGIHKSEHIQYRERCYMQNNCQNTNWPVFKYFNSEKKSRNHTKKQNKLACRTNTCTAR